MKTFNTEELNKALIGLQIAAKATSEQFNKTIQEIKSVRFPKPNNKEIFKTIIGAASVRRK